MPAPARRRCAFVKGGASGGDAMPDSDEAKPRAGLRLGARGPVYVRPDTPGAAVMAGEITEAQFIRATLEAQAKADAADLNNPLKGLHRLTPFKEDTFVDLVDRVAAQLARPVAQVVRLESVKAQAPVETVEIKACKKPGEAWTPVLRAELLRQFRWLTQDCPSPTKAHLADEVLGKKWSVCASNIKAHRLAAVKLEGGQLDEALPAISRALPR